MTEKKDKKKVEPEKIEGDDFDVEVEGGPLPPGMGGMIMEILKKKKRTTIFDHLGIKRERYDELSREVFGVVFTHCCDGEQVIIRKLFPKIKDTEEIAKMVLFAKAMGRLYAEKDHP